jgi:hypothetical protein
MTLKLGVSLVESKERKLPYNTHCSKIGDRWTIRQKVKIGVKRGDICIYINQLTSKILT